MGTIFSGNRIFRFILIASVVLAAISPVVVHAASAVMQDYCQVPPFIGVTKPNLMLMIDNSASMYDLQYVDTGWKQCNPSGANCVTNLDCPNKVCSTTTTTSCTADSNCPSGEFCKPTETCSNVLRESSYCFDESYSSRHAYEGYFDRVFTNTSQTQYYQYQSAPADYFAPLPSAYAFPADSGSCAGGNQAAFIPNALCVQLTGFPPSRNVVSFVASGNYLNWLAASKFDIEKSILTGGKYGALDAASYGLYPESRGCVGRKFVKLPLSADFVNYSTGTADPNVTPVDKRLGITFGIRGPVSANPSDVSPGGRTYIEIFDGNFDAQKCQDAIDLYLSLASSTDPARKQELLDAVNNCLSNASTNQKTCSLNNLQTCNLDRDCSTAADICNITIGSCISAGGVCGENVAGVCSVNNGTCTGARICVGGNRPGIVCTRDQDCTGNGTCMLTCSGGGKAGATCSTDAQCASSTCTAGDPAKIGTPCTAATASTDCGSFWCTNGDATTNPNYHRTCTSSAQCNVGTCSAGRVGNACAQSSDCDLGVCAAGSLRAGNACTANTDCGYGVCMAPATTQIKSTFAQSMLSCYQYLKNGVYPGINEIQQVSNPNGCNQIYKEYAICNGGSHDGYECGVNNPTEACPGGTCVNGLNAIRPGSPVLLCSASYAGHCATTTDSWNSTTWVPREYTSADCTWGSFSDKDCCILERYVDYCNAVQVPPVTDPTDDPSSTTSYNNLPAIINDVGVTAQLRDPIKIMEARMQKGTPPTGLIQDFASMIRIGAMSFDFNGSKYECGTMKYCSNNTTRTCTTNLDCTPGVCVVAVPCPYVCNNETERACTLLPDGTTPPGACAAGGTCVLSSTLASDSNKDGAHVLADAYIGDSIPNTPNGGHTVPGLVNTLDNLQAGAWTPFSEAMYNAIGYYAETSLTTRLTAQMLNPTYPDFYAPIDTTPKTEPSQSNCQKNNVLMITDGQPTADLNSSVTGLITANSGRFPATDYTLNYNTTFDNACYLYAGSKNVDDLAWLAQHRNIHDFSTTPTYDRDRIRTYTVFSGTGSLTQPDCTAKTDAQLAAMDECLTDNLMCKTARNGKGTYYMAQDPAALKVSLKNAFLEIAAKATSGTAASVLASGEGSGANLIQALFYPRRTFDFNTETLWAGSLQNLWYFVDPFFSNSNIREDTVRDGVLNLRNDYVVSLRFNNDPTVNKVQVDRAVDTTGDGSPDGPATPATIDIERIGSLWEAGNALWSRTTARKIYTNCFLDHPNYCIADAALNNTGVMELSTANFDTPTRQAYLQAAGAAESSNIINYTLGTDISGYRPRAVTVDLNANRTPEAGETNVWKLGDVLNSTPKIASWMPLNTYNRIYGDNTYGLPFQDLNPSDGDNEGSFVTSRNAMDGTPAGTGYRNRGMAFAGANDGMLHAFRLGTLQLKWTGSGSTTDPLPAQGTTMHARLLRTCSKSNVVCDDSNAAARCPGDTCPQLGEEMWAFVPKQTLPFLKYMADINYCHVYSVDLTPFIFDASIEGPDANVAACPGGNYWNCTRARDSWRTVLIGGMRYGGSCKAKVCSVTTATKCAKDGDCPAGETCVNPSAGSKSCSTTISTACTADGDCPAGESCKPNTIGTPVLDPADTTKGLGYSSYFALDVTESLADASKPPRLMWEFTHEGLGLASAAPAVVRIKALSDPTLAFDPVSTNPGYNPPETAPGSRDGRFFVVLGSGPTGPITDTQMLGRSDQNLMLFVFDLKNGPGANNADVTVIDTGITNAFAGSMLNSTFDSNLDYQDDVVYFGYVKQSAADPTKWTDGGVGRLLTTTGSGASVKNALYPTNWEFSKLIDGIGPVTSAVVKLQNNKTNKLWTYFGTGRYIYKTSTEADDNTGRRTLFGVTDPCFNTNAWPNGPFDGSCTAAAYTRALGDLNDATDVNNAGDDPEGWRVSMEDAIPNPDPALALGAERVITDPLATSSGMVFFTTFAPYYDICTLGGKSYVWALKYDTAESPGAMLKGKALVQVSTGSIEQVDMSTQFKQKGDRRTAAMEGVPPTAQGLAIISSPPPVKRVLHMKER